LIIFAKNTVRFIGCPRTRREKDVMMIVRAEINGGRSNEGTTSRFGTWRTPKLEEIEYTDELRRLYRCEVIREAAQGK
jgi:hypothetical protein